MTPAPVCSEHLPAILSLNKAAEQETGPLLLSELQQMIAGAALALQINHGQGVLIVFDETAGFYQSPNYQWFKSRHQRFWYVDRIIIGADLRGQGAGKALYHAVFSHIEAAGGCILGCEVNTIPANPRSHAFHQSLGFEEKGAAILARNEGGMVTKAVNYYEKQIPAG